MPRQERAASLLEGIVSILIVALAITIVCLSFTLVAKTAVPDTASNVAVAVLAPLHPVVSLDSLNGNLIDVKTGLVHVGSGSWRLQGWAAGDAASSIPFSKLRFFIDGKPSATVVRGVFRPDVAAFLKAPTLTNTGFTAIFDRALPPGHHDLTISVEAPDGRVAQTNVSLRIAR